jgi:hypothetical protein
VKRSEMVNNMTKWANEWQAAVLAYFDKHGTTKGWHHRGHATMASFVLYKQEEAGMRPLHSWEPEDSNVEF